jgi:Uma2 family endonuclease
LVAIDGQLLKEARALGKHRTNREAICAALDEYVRPRKQCEILSLFGKIEYHDSYNYKLERKGKP